MRVFLISLMRLAFNAMPLSLIEGGEAGIPCHRQIDPGQIEAIGPGQQLTIEMAAADHHQLIWRLGLR
jgi:hypothetical protein